MIHHTKFKYLFLIIFSSLAIGGSASSSTIDLEFINSAPTTSSIGINSASVATSEFTVETRGYVSEISGSTDTVKGAFEVRDFRTCTNANSCGATSRSGLHYYNRGFGLLAGDTATVDAAGRDRGFGSYAPGFNGYYIKRDTPGILISQFASFSFDKAVDIGGVIVDDVSNFSRNVWMAYSDQTIDLSNGLGSALSSLTVINSSDDASDGLFTHGLNGTGIKTLLVGAPIRDGSYAGIDTGDSQFFIRGFEDIGVSTNGSDNNGGDVSPVPLPATGLLLLAGLGAAAGIRRIGAAARD